jgi:hypothetical protein
MTTSILYLIGTFSYLLLIRAVEKREARDVAPTPIPEPGQV